MKNIITIVVFQLCCAFAFADEIDRIDFLIPGGEGGGWDTTARQTGQALVKEGIVKKVEFRNMSGGGGGRALVELIDKQASHNNTLMVQSTPIILRNLTGVIKNNYRDITPISLIIAEYQVLAVAKNSPYKSVTELIEAIEAERGKNPLIGGSSKGSLDHITAALLLKAAGSDPKKLRYIASDGGGEALDRLYKGVGVALVSGFGEVVEDYQQGKIKILGITSESRIPNLDIPTMKEQGIDVVFANWRGFFAKPGLDDKRKSEYVAALEKLSQSDVWSEVRAKYGWESFVKNGGELDGFLQEQEASIKETLLTLGIIK